MARVLTGFGSGWKSIGCVAVDNRVRRATVNAMGKTVALNMKVPTELVERIDRLANAGRFPSTRTAVGTRALELGLERLEREVEKDSKKDEG